MGQFYTDFLTASSTALTGAGTVCGIAGNYYEFNRSSTPQQADAKAILQDWGMVFQDVESSWLHSLKGLSLELDNVRQ